MLMNAVNCDVRFNSQPHEEADNGIIGIPSKFNVSTHSLTRRLTNCNKQIFKTK